MPPLSILIKPSSSNCNLRCKYCFYRSIADSRETESYGLMHTETLEQLVKNALGTAEGSCFFAFQGGEPMLAGLSFYQQLMEFEKKYNTGNLTIEHTIQTNGTLIDDAWAKFFAENHFLVGLSLDGPRKINDAYREKAGACNSKMHATYAMQTGTDGTFDDIMGAVNALKRCHADFNILSVITSKAASQAEQMYRFFRKQDFHFLQFIPCLDELPTERNAHKFPPACPRDGAGNRGLAAQNAEYSLQTGQYGRFLIKMFELWEKDFKAGADVEIRFFTNLIQMAAGYPPESCGMCGHCTPYPVVEGDGSVYPCDFYVTEDWKLGDVKTSLTDLLNSEKAKEFAKPSEHVSEKCRECKHFRLCRGGCRRWREPIINGLPSVNCLCEDYKLFFDACTGGIFELARRYLMPALF